MEIFGLIDREYAAVSVLEDMKQIAEWLLERDYYAVVDEKERIIGIVTAKDLLHYPDHQVIDADISKPIVRPDNDLKKVLEMMQASHSDHLPVYEGYHFVGVVSHWALTQHLLSVIAEMEQENNILSHFSESI